MKGKARFVPRTAPPARKRGDVRHLVPFVIAERSGLEGKEDASKEWGGPGDRRGNRTGRRTSLPQGLRTGSRIAARNGPAPVAGFAGPRAIRGALKPDQVTSSASSIVKERMAAVPLAGPPRAAGAPVARGSRSAWPPRRIRDGLDESKRRAKRRSDAAAGACAAAHALPRIPSFRRPETQNHARWNRSFNYGRRMYFSRTYDDFFRLRHWAAIGGRQRGKRLGNIFGNGAVDALATPMSSPKNSLARGGVRTPPQPILEISIDF